MFVWLGRRRIRSVALVAAAVVAVLFGLALAPDRDGVTKAAARPGSATPVAATLTISSQPGTPVPRSFLGLSTEYWSVPSYNRHPAWLERVLKLIRAPGDGPVILRVGGDSADRTFWVASVRRKLPWMFELTPAWFRELRSVVRRTGVHVIIDLNLVTGSSWMAAEWAAAAEAALPRGTIAGFEVGNEPDIYSRQYWARATASGTLNPDLLPQRLTPATYVAEFRTYARTLAEVAPRAPLIGPVVANPNRHLSWVKALLSGPHRGLGAVSVHRYPYSACARKSSPAFPTVARLLSQKASLGVARSVAPAVRLAHRAGLPLRLTELNSVTCGGRPGVSNTFATALWAPDTLFELVRAGVNGANVHVREGRINAAFAMSRAGFSARPLLYGLALFARSLGPGADLLHTVVRSRSTLPLKAWAIRLRAGLHVVLIDKGPEPVRVDLALPETGPATLERLLAPSVRSTRGVTLGGQWLGRDARWHGRPAAENITRTRRGYMVTVPRFSAALLSVS